MSYIQRFWSHEASRGNAMTTNSQKREQVNAERIALLV